MRSETRSFAAYIVVGSTSSAVNIGARMLFDRFMSYEAAIIFAFIVSVVVAFLLYRRFVFDVTGPEWPTQFAKFVTVNLFGLVQVFCVSLLLARALFPAIGFTYHAETIAHVMGVGSPVLTSYFLHKHISFGRGRAVS